MATEPAPDVKSSRWQWFVVGRWQEYAGESRANLLRLIAIGAFYLVELINFHYVGQGDEAYLRFHRTATALAVGWILLALLVLLCVRRQIFPPTLKYVSTGCDIVLLSLLALSVEGSTGGPASPLVFVYFLIIALAGLRFHLRLVWCATLGSMLGYLCLVAAADMRDHGQWFDGDHAVPIVEQLMVLLAMALVGIIVGQIVRQARTLAEEFNSRMADSERSER